MKTGDVTGTNATYEADCNDPDSHDLNCTEPTRAIINQALQQGYQYYIGHAEPTTEFFSTRGTSGYDMQWKLSLPATEPSPTQNGTNVANFELYSTFWLGLALCDPNSNPFGACVAASDSNNPNTAGAAFLELQFYPPGLNCSNSQWCVSLHINTLQNKSNFQINNCLEPTTAALLTTNGVVGGPTLLMNNGDTLVVTIHDTANGLETDVDDITTGTTGSMVSSGANGFVHNANQTDCTTTAFDFHAMYATASPGQVVPWAALGPNVAWDFEIGHWELCGNSNCTILPDGDSDDTNCTTVRGIGGCFGSDLDHDGTPYLAGWPDGNTVNHPASVILGSSDDKGIGPLSAHPTNLTSYDEGYNQVSFVTTENTNGAFYPFYTQAGTGGSCRFNFGNDIPGVTSNDFGKAAQYGTSILNPCLPGIAADLAITKTGPASASAGTNVTYTIGVTNNGPSNATNVVVTDTLPFGVSFVSSTIACTNSAGTLTCNLGSMGNGATTSFNVTIHIPSNGVGSPSITNTASVTADQLDPTLSNNTASVTTTLVFVADLAITKTGSPTTAPAGTNVTYSIGVSNAGPSDATNVVVSDALPAGINFVSSSPFACTGTSVLSCNLGTLPKGASTNLTVVVNIPANYLSSRGLTTATITNTATVTSDATDPNLSNNTASASTTVIAVADLLITKSAAPNPVAAGTNLTYTLNVRNAGPSDATGSVVTDTLPVGVNFVSSSPFACTGTTVLTCKLGTIAKGATDTFTIVVAIPANYLSSRFLKTATITNTAKVSSAVTDPNLSNNTASVATQVIAVADLDMTVTAAPNPVHEGSTLTYTIIFINIGPSDAPQATILQYFPAGFQFVGATHETCNASTSVMLCRLGEVVPAGFGLTFQVTYHIPSNFLGAKTPQSVTSQLGIRSQAIDPDPIDSTIYVTTTVIK